MQRVVRDTSTELTKPFNLLHLEDYTISSRSEKFIELQPLLVCLSLYNFKKDTGAGAPLNLAAG